MHLLGWQTKAAEQAVTLGVTQAGERLKSDWRAQITGAGLGAKLARTIRMARYHTARHGIAEGGERWFSGGIFF
jgi:hypothetical protein